MHHPVVRDVGDAKVVVQAIKHLQAARGGREL
jgi:hypothetical protein